VNESCDCGVAFMVDNGGSEEFLAMWRVVLLGEDIESVILKPRREYWAARIRGVGPELGHVRLRAIPLSPINSMVPARHPALECCKYFTIVVHHNAEVDLIGVCGMGLRLSVESVDVSNGMKR
jgi:hypothetical protein